MTFLKIWVGKRERRKHAARHGKWVFDTLTQDSTALLRLVKEVDPRCRRVVHQERAAAWICKLSAEEIVLVSATAAAASAEAAAAAVAAAVHDAVVVRSHSLLSGCISFVGATSKTAPHDDSVENPSALRKATSEEIRRGGKKKSTMKKAKLTAKEKKKKKKEDKRKEDKRKKAKAKAKARAKSEAKAAKEKALLKPLAVGASVVIATDSPRFGFGLVRRGEVGTITHVGTIPTGGAAGDTAMRATEVTVRFPSEGEWRGELGEIAPAPSAASGGRSARPGAADLPVDDAGALGLIVIPHADESSAVVVASCGGALGPLACNVKKGVATAIAAPLDARVGAAPGRWYYEWSLPKGAKKGGVVRVGWANMAAVHVYSAATKEGAPREQMPWPHPDAAAEHDVRQSVADVGATCASWSVEFTDCQSTAVGVAAHHALVKTEAPFAAPSHEQQHWGLKGGSTIGCFLSAVAGDTLSIAYTIDGVECGAVSASIEGWSPMLDGSERWVPAVTMYAKGDVLAGTGGGAFNLGAPRGAPLRHPPPQRFSAVYCALYTDDVASERTSDSLAALLRPRVAHVQLRCAASPGDAFADIVASDAPVERFVAPAQRVIAARLLAETLDARGSARGTPPAVRADTARMATVFRAASGAAEAALAAAAAAATEAAVALDTLCYAAAARLRGEPSAVAATTERVLASSCSGTVVDVPPLDLSAPLGVSAWFKLHEADKPLTVLALPRRALVITVGITQGSYTVSPQGNTVGQIDFALVHHGVRVTSGSVTLTDSAGVDVREWQHIAVVVDGSAALEVAEEAAVATKATDSNTFRATESDAGSVQRADIVACAAGSNETYAVYLNGSAVALKLAPSDAVTHRPLDGLFAGGAARAGARASFPPLSTAKGKKPSAAEMSWMYAVRNPAATVSPFVLAASRAAAGAARTVVIADAASVAASSPGRVMLPIDGTRASSSSSSALHVEGAGGWAEWKLRLPTDVAAATIALHFNAAVASPLTLSIDGVVLDRAVANSTTGSIASPATLMWLEAPCGPFAIRGGEVTLRLEATNACGLFPAIAAIAVHWASDDIIVTERAGASQLCSLVVVGGAASAAKRRVAGVGAGAEGAAAASYIGDDAREVGEIVRAYYTAPRGEVGCAPAAAAGVAYPGTTVASALSAVSPLLREHLVLHHFASAAKLRGPATVKLPARYANGNGDAVPLSACVVVLEPLAIEHLSVAERTTAAARAYADALAWRRMYGAAVGAQFKSYQFIGLYRSRLRRAAALYSETTAARLRGEWHAIGRNIAEAEVVLGGALRALRVAKLRRATMPRVAIADRRRCGGGNGAAATKGEEEASEFVRRVSIETTCSVVPFEMARRWPVVSWGHDDAACSCAPRALRDGVEIYRYASGQRGRARFVGAVPRELFSSEADARAPTLIATDAKYYTAKAPDALTLRIASAADLARDFSLGVRRAEAGVVDEAWEDGAAGASGVDVPERVWLLVAVYCASRRPSFLTQSSSGFALTTITLDVNGLKLPFELWERSEPLEPGSTVCIGGLGYTDARNRRTGAADSGDKNLFCIVRIGRHALARSSEDWGATAAAAEAEDGSATKESDGGDSADEEGEEKALWEVKLDSGWILFDGPSQRVLETEHKVRYSVARRPPARSCMCTQRVLHYRIYGRRRLIRLFDVAHLLPFAHPPLPSFSLSLVLPLPPPPPPPPLSFPLSFPLSDHTRCRARCAADQSISRFVACGTPSTLMR